MNKDDEKLLKSAAESIESVRAISSATNALEQELKSLEQDMSSSSSTEETTLSLSLLRPLHLLLSARGLVGDATELSQRG